MTEPSDEWEADGGREAMRHDTGRKVNVDEEVVANRMFPKPVSYAGNPRENYHELYSSSGAAAHNENFYSSQAFVDLEILRG